MHASYAPVLRLIKLNCFFITFFMVAYVPSEVAVEGRKAKCVLSLNSTVVLVPAREHVKPTRDRQKGAGRL